MSDQFPSLAEVLAKHVDITNDEWRNNFMHGHPSCACGWEQNDDSGIGPFWSDHFAEMWRETRMIRTPDQLDALPVGTVLREDYDGTIWTLHDGGKHIDAFRECDYLPLLTSAISLPARVIHNPDWETK